MADEKHTRTGASESAKPEFPVYSRRSTEKANKAAHAYYADGKSFQAAMLDAGYSEATAKQGPKFMMRHSVGLRAAFERASRQHFSPEQLKTMAIHRLTVAIADKRSSDGIKAIEVLGKMKEYDWFVRNGEMAIGFMLTLSENSPDESANTLDAYKEE